MTDLFTVSLFINTLLLNYSKELQLESVTLVECLQSLRENFELFSGYCENGKTMSLQEFESFLVVEQEDPIGNDERAISQFMRDYLQDPQRNVQEPYFTVNEVSVVYYNITPKQSLL